MRTKFREFPNGLKAAMGAYTHKKGHSVHRTIIFPAPSGAILSVFWRLIAHIQAKPCLTNEENRVY